MREAAMTGSMPEPVTTLFMVKQGTTGFMAEREMTILTAERGTTTSVVMMEMISYMEERGTTGWRAEPEMIHISSILETGRTPSGTMSTARQRERMTASCSARG